MIVIPAELADEIAAEAVEMIVFENFVIERVRGASKPLACIRLTMRPI